MPRLLTNAELQDLEDLIDQASLNTVLNSLAQICFAKQSHVEENWTEDKALAKAWYKNGCNLTRLAGYPEAQGV